MLTRAPLLSGVMIVLTLIFASAALAQTVDSDFWAANGTVRAMVRDGSALFIGGDFTQVGPATGSGVPIDISTGGLPASFAKVIGQVYAVAPDGTGGLCAGRGRLERLRGGLLHRRERHATEWRGFDGPRGDLRCADGSERGRRVGMPISSRLEAGTSELVWQDASARTGVYFARMSADGVVRTTGPIILLR